MKRIFLIFAIPFFLSSCFSIRSPFVPINYYYLSQEPFSFKNIAEIETYLVVREFTVPNDLLDDRLMIWYDDGTVQKFNYHRFSADYSKVINNFILTRMNLSRAFKYGVFSLSSAVVPNFILEGQVLEFKTYTERKDKKKNWTQIALQINMIKYEPMATNKKVVFTKTYSQRIDFDKQTQTNIVQNYSKALALLVDKMILDIQSAIAHYSGE